MKGILRKAVAGKRAYACLFYHRVCKEGDPCVNPATKVARGAFRRQMQFLKSHCAPLPVTEMTARLRERINPDRFYVAVTFDDGYRDNFTEAFPIISQMGIPITVFLATGFIDEPNRVPWWDLLERVALTNQGRISCPAEGEQFHFNLESPLGKRHFFRTLSSHLKDHPNAESRVRKSLQPYAAIACHRPNDFMRWGEVRLMAASTLVTLAPHTCRHPNLGETSPVVFDEIRVSRERILQETGTVADLFSYPFGRFERTEAGVNPLFSYLETLGIKAAFTTTPGDLTPKINRFILPRIPISGRDSETRFLLKLCAPGLIGQVHRLWGKFR